MICPPSHSHAANSTCRSVHHCKCEPCRDRARRYENWRQKQGPLLLDATGTHRRIRALNRLGWSSYALSARAGQQPTWVSSVLRNETVSRKTAARVRALYDELSMTIPPVSASSTRARNHAIREGWLPPLAYDEETIDMPEFGPAETGEAA